MVVTYRTALLKADGGLVCWDEILLPPVFDNVVSTTIPSR